MRWGHRKQIPLVGRTRLGQSIQSRANNFRTSAANRIRKVTQSRGAKIAKRVAIGAAVVGGTALAVYGGMKAGKLLSTPQGRQAISMAMNNALFRAKNATRTARQMSGNATRVLRQNPLSNAAKSLGNTGAGRIAVKGIAAASLASDVNTVRQWTGGVKKRGKVTKRDVKDLTLDLINPIPDNIPGLAKKNKYDYR